MHSQVRTRRAFSFASLLVALVASVAACQQGAGATGTPGTTSAATTAPIATSTPASTIEVTAAPATPTAAPATSAATEAPTAGPSGLASSIAFVRFVSTPGGSTQIVGGATLIEVEGQTQVVIGILPTDEDPIAASIQEGTCDELDPLIAFPLTEVSSGASTTQVDVELATLLESDYAINLSVFGSETESSLACGNIEPLPAP